MKFRLTCAGCARELPPGSYPIGEGDLFVVSIVDDGVHFYTCPKGHTTATIHQGLKFEMLFESGIRALLDGYGRESVASCAAALERFLEFFVRVICRAKGMAGNAVNATWKTIDSRSEAQAGAFYLAHLLHTGRAFDVQDPKFRNKVIHKGYFPRENEATAYAKYVYDTVTELLGQLEGSVPDAVEAEFMDRVRTAHKKAEAADFRSTFGVSTVIDFLARSTTRPSFDEEFARLKRRGGRPVKTT